MRSMIFSGMSFDFLGQLRDGHDRIDPAVGDDVRDFLLAQQEVDRHHALARQQRSVETGGEALPAGSSSPTRGLSVWNER